jgi:hypothetical protein
MVHHLRNVVFPFALVMAAGVFVDAAHAGVLSYVSSTGNDANACTFAAPCRTLQRAISATKTGGEVRVIDSAGYGAAIAIGKSITISGDGATIFAGKITINSASAVVTLRGLLLNGGGTLDIGVNIQAAKAVHIERCTIYGFGDGVALTATAADLTVTDSVMRDNGADGLVAAGATNARVTVDNSRFENNGQHGLYVALSAPASVSRSVASGNGVAGIQVEQAKITITATTSNHNGTYGYFLSSGEMTLESVTADTNANGLFVNTGTARLSNSVITGNSNAGIFVSTGTLLTRQNNTVSGNTADVSGTLTPLGGV